MYFSIRLASLPCQAKSISVVNLLYIVNSLSPPFLPSLVKSLSLAISVIVAKP